MYFVFPFFLISSFCIFIFITIIIISTFLSVWVTFICISFQNQVPDLPSILLVLFILSWLSSNSYIIFRTELASDFLFLQTWIVAALTDFSWLKRYVKGMLKLRLRLKKDKSSNYIFISGYCIDRKNIVIIQFVSTATTIHTICNITIIWYDL